jgi:MFS family permease
MVGLLSVAEFAPMLLVAFFAGAFADHFDRRQIILGCESLMTAALATLIVNALLPHPHIPLLFVAPVLLAALNSVHQPAKL